jgi:hypothetical protein
MRAWTAARRLGRSTEEARFTLIELQVALMIAVLIASFIPGALRLGKRVWETDKAFEERAGLSAFMRYAEQRLAEAMLVYRRGGGLEFAVDFAGEPGRVSFIALAPAARKSVSPERATGPERASCRRWGKSA